MPKQKALNAVKLGKKIIEEAKKELNEEREKNYKNTAKSLLEDIETAKKTVCLLEKQLKNFIKEIEVYN